MCADLESDGADWTLEGNGSAGWGWKGVGAREEGMEGSSAAEARKQFETVTRGG